MTGEKVGVEAVIDGMSQFRADASEFNTRIGGMSSQVQESSGIMSSLGDIAKGALAFAVGTIAVDAFNRVKDAAVDFFQQALAGEQQQAGLAALIKSTGDASGLTQQQVNDLANKMKDLAGGSDEAVVAIEEIGIRSGAINAQEMPQFIQNVLDLGTVMGDASAAATLLARAQEDPVAALGKLQKAGILFSEAQKDQIKTMVKAGDTAGATAIIMARVAEATGGAAAANADTLAGRWEILTNHFADAGKSIAMNLLPMAEQLFDAVIKPAIPIVEDLAARLGEWLPGAIQTAVTYGQALFTSWSAVLMPALQSAWAWIQSELVPLLQQLGNIVLKGLGVSAGELGTAFTDQLLPDLTSAWTWMQKNLLPLLSDLWNWLKVALPAGVTTLVNFWNNVLLPALIAFSNWERDTLGPILASLYAWLQTWLPGALQTLANFWMNVLQPALVQVWGWVTSTLFPTLSTLWTWISTTLTQSIQGWSLLWTNTLQPALTQVWSWMTGSLFPTLSTLWTWISTTLTQSISGWSTLWTTTLQPALAGVWSWMNTVLFPFLTSLNTLIDATLGLTLRTFAGYWSGTVQPALSGVNDYLNVNLYPALHTLWDFLANTFAPVFSAVGDAIGSFVGGALATLGSVLAGISGDIQTLTGWINTLIGLINSIPGVPGAGGGGNGRSSSTTSAMLASGSNYSSSSSVNYNYAPTYGSTPASPARDFGIMKALAI